MKNLTDNELGIWIRGGNVESDENIYFVIIKTPTCPKCERLKNNAEKVFGNLAKNVATYVLDTKPNSVGVAICTDLQITSAPAIIWRYQVNNEWKKGVVVGDFNDQDYIDLKCTFDAINDCDYSYFGYNEVDEPIETDANKGYNRLLHLIYGEADPEKVRNYKLLKKEIN